MNKSYTKNLWNQYRLSFEVVKGASWSREHVIVFITPPLCSDCTSVHFAQHYFYNCNPLELKKGIMLKVQWIPGLKPGENCTQSKEDTVCAVSLWKCALAEWEETCFQWILSSSWFCLKESVESANSHSAPPPPWWKCWKTFSWKIPEDLSSIFLFELIYLNDLNDK